MKITAYTAQPPVFSISLAPLEEPTLPHTSTSLRKRRPLHLQTLEERTTPSAVAPITVKDDRYTAATFGTLSVNGKGVLKNDARGLIVTNYMEQSTWGAAVVVHPSGSVRYSPIASAALLGLAPGTKVQDTFTYTVTNKTGQTNTATVTVNVKIPALVPDWRGDVVRQDQVLQVNATEGLLANDHQPVSAPVLAVQKYAKTSLYGAKVQVNPDGSYSYDPTTAKKLLALMDGQIVTDRFDYWVKGQGKTTAYVNVAGVQSGTEDVGTTDAMTPLVVPANGLLANDPGTNPLVILSDTQSAYGATVAVQPDGSYVYTPTDALQLKELSEGDIVYDTFTYTAKAGKIRTKATVTIAVTGVNNAPTVNDDHAETAADTAFASTFSVLANDSELDADDAATPLVISAADTSSLLGAMVNVRPDGTFIYDPTASELIADLARSESIEDSFTYTVEDHHGASVTGTVRVTVRGIEHGVQGQADTYTAFADGVLAIDAATGVLANDSDADINDTLRVVDYARTSTNGATVQVAPDGSFVYDPTHAESFLLVRLGETLTDSFTYVVSDGQGSLKTTVVTVKVRGALHGADDSILANLIDPYLSEVPGVLYNDGLVNPTVTTFDATSTLGASIAMNADGSYTYDATSLDPQVVADAVAASEDPDWIFDYFTYQATDTSSIVQATVAVAIDMTGTIPLGRSPGNLQRPPSPVVHSVSGNMLTITTTQVPVDRSGVRVEVTPIRGDGAFDIIYETWLNLPHGRVWRDYNILGTYNYSAGVTNITFNGSSRDDLFVADWQSNYVVQAFGNAGDDRLIGSGANCTLNGGAGYDSLYGQNANDVLYGGTEIDELYGWYGNDTLYGDDGYDLLDGGYGDDILVGGTGADKFIGGPGSTMAIGPNRSEGDEFNPTPADRINAKDGDLIVGLKSEPQTDRDLSASSGTLVASLNDTSATLTLNGPSLYGFRFNGSAGAFQVKTLTGGGEEFIARSPLTMTTALGTIPIPASATFPLIVRTSPDAFARAGSVTSISIKHLLALKTTNPDDPLASFKNDFGLNFAPSGLQLDFGLKLGKDLDGLGVGAPLNPSVPYFYFSSGAASMPTLSLGETSISGGVSGGIYVAFDPSDPFLYLKTVIPGSPLSEIAFAGSAKGLIPFIPKQTPSIFSGNGPVKFREATASFSQPAYNISSTIDGIASGYNGWATGGQANVVQTAVFQTTTPLNTDQVIFDLAFNAPFIDHQLQKLRLSYTTSADPTATSSANWLPLNISSAKQKKGTATINGDGSISFTNGKSNDTYQLTADGPFDGVTGFRLEAIPVSGKLSFYSTGNFVLSEFKATAARQDPAVNVPQLFGNVFGEAKLNIDKFQVSLEGGFVLDLDANNDGTPLGLSGNELSRLFKGKESLDTVLGNILTDVRVGANAKVNAEIGLGSTGLAVTVPLASATAIFKDNTIGVKGATAQPFAGTPLSFIQSPSVEAEGYITGKGDFGFGFKIQEAKLGNFSLGGTAASLYVDNSGAKFEASYRLPIVNVQASVVGSVNSQGLFEFIASAGASFNAGPVTISGSLVFRFANFNTPGVPLNGVTLSAELNVGGEIWLPTPFPNVFVRAKGKIQFTATNQGLSIAGSGRVEGGAGSISVGVGFTFNNTGFTVSMPGPIPNLSVRY